MKTFLQFGNLNFGSIDQNQSNVINVDTDLQENKYGDGSVSNNNKSYLNDSAVEVSYSICLDTVDMEAMKKLLYSGYQKIFFYEKVYKKPFFDYDIDYDINIYWNYAKVTKHGDYNNSENITKGEDKKLYREIEITFTLQNPYLHLAQGDCLTYLSNRDLESLQSQRWNNNLQWNNGERWNAETTLIKEFNKMSKEDKKKLFEDDGNCCMFDGLLFYKDLFYQHEVNSIIGTIEDNNYAQLNVTNSNEIFLTSENKTINGNNSDSRYQTGLNLLTTVNSRINAIEIKSNQTKVFNAGDSLTIYNQDTKSGFTINWLSINCPSSIIIFTHENGGIYDNSTGLDLMDNFEGGNYENAFTVDFAPESDSYYSIEFSNHYPVNQYLDSQQVDRLEITKNSTNNFTIKILNLPSFI